uniref:Uncharacterized protein n=1 Tax=Anguilla anguilla TaxID=7936 RepID=A0A0E9S544_ANGAN
MAGSPVRRISLKFCEPNQVESDFR